MKPSSLRSRSKYPTVICNFKNKDGVMHGVLDVYGEMTSLGGHIVNTFEKSLVLDVPEHEFQIVPDPQSPFISTPFRSSPAVTS